MSIVTNINEFYTKYGNKIKSDFHLIIAYWKVIDQVEMKDGHVKISSLINKATCPEEILRGKRLYEVMREEGIDID